MNGYLQHLVLRVFYAYLTSGRTAVTTGTTFSWSAATGYAATIPKPRYAEIVADAACYYATGGTAAGTATATAGHRYLPADTPTIVALPKGSDPTLKIMSVSGTANVAVNFGL